MKQGFICDGHEYTYCQVGEEHHLRNIYGTHVATAYHLFEYWAVELEAQPAHGIEARFLGQFHDSDVPCVGQLLVGQYAAATS